MSQHLDDKAQVEHVDEIGRDPEAYGDLKETAEDRVILTEEDNRRILRKTDRNLMPLLMWVYFLQIFDKTVFGFGNTYGLSKDLGLVSKQYSLASSMTAIAVLSWQPFSSYVIVRVPARYLMTILVFCWGTSEACMSAVHNKDGLYACRFLLGLFEAGCIPLFSMITAQWYRRSEQPLRVCAWFVMNSVATIVAAILAYGVGHITSGPLYSWQVLYLIAGVLTVLTAPLVWFRLESDVATAKWWKDDHERAQAIERLRANQTGTGSHEFKWAQALEVLYDPKSWLFGSLTCLANIGASIANTFGPTLIKSFGFGTNDATLLNMPFGATQAIAIILGCWAAYKWRTKSSMLAIQAFISLIGGILLFVANRTKTTDKGMALAGYYLLAFTFGISPVAYSWAIANTAGTTKKSAMLSLGNCLTAVGQITGPLLMNSKDAPHYRPGLKALMASTVGLLAAVGILVGLLFLLNKQRQRQRVAVGKPKHLHDLSMEKTFQNVSVAADDVGAHGLEDLTDFKNDEFVYVY